MCTEWQQNTAKSTNRRHQTLLHYMLISRIFNNNKYQISYGFTGKFIGKVHKYSVVLISFAKVKICQ